MNDKDIKDTLNTAQDKLPDPQQAIQTGKDKLPNITPKPPGIQAQSSAQDLKARLEWGEPALTIIDVSDRATFNHSHITGAIPVPIEALVDVAQESRIEPSRDVYIYGENDAQTAKAAETLRKAGWQNVAELHGGLAAWKAIAGPTDGTEDSQKPPEGQEGYNVIATVKHHLETQNADNLDLK